MRRPRPSPEEADFKPTLAGSANFFGRRTHKKTHRFFLFASLLLLVALCLQAKAQNVPPGDQPGAQGSRFQAASEKEKERLEKEKIKAPQIEIEEEKEIPSGAEGLSFLLKNVRITGSTVFKPQDFRSAYETYIGKQVTFGDLEEIVDAIKAKYKQKGYLSTDVYIPEQDIAEGEVEIRVFEGTLGEIRVEGNRWFSASLLRKYIHVKKKELLNIFTLQKDLLRLNQNPDLEVKAVLAAGRDPATTDIILKVKDSRPYHAGANFDNQGTRLVGKQRTSFSLRHTNLAGRFDAVSAIALFSATSSGQFFSYTVPLDTFGTRAGCDVTFFEMKLGKELESSDITGATRIYTLHISRELFLSEDFQAYADTGINIKSIERKNAGETSAKDQLRMPYAAFDLAKTDTFLGGGQTFFAPRLSLSTEHFLGASSRGHPSASRPGTGGFFVKYEHGLRRIQRAPFGSHISARSQFQAASHTLPSSEQLQLGGASSVRGYPEGEYLADTGVTLNIEWFFPCPIFAKNFALPGADRPLRDQLQLVFFVDTATGKLKKVGPGEKDGRFLMGAGAGMRFQFNRNFFLRLDGAGRLGDRPAPGQGPANFYITAQFEI